MADRCFRAAVKLVAEGGAYCKSNGRCLRWTEREILEALDAAPNVLVVGADHEARTVVQRRPEDARAPQVIGGPLGGLVREDQYLATMQSYIQEPLVDMLITGTLDTVYGRDPRARSPWEILVGWHEAELALTAARRAGREGIAMFCVSGASSDIAELSATSYGGFRPTDIHMVAMISEHKTSYDLLNKATHLVKTGSIIHAYCNTIYGGLAGGAEGIAVAETAGMIILQLIYMPATHAGATYHPTLTCNTTLENLWALGLCLQALTRNTPMIVDGVNSPAAGPMTKLLLYEVAAAAVAYTASGAARLMGPRTEASKHISHVSPLEARFMGEVGRAAAGMSREQANELVKQIEARYHGQLGGDVKGVPFDEAYDLHTLRPRAAWVAMYDDVRDEMGALGLALR
jgi:methylamine--corrinoid protein Co-methyltransferase